MVGFLEKGYIIEDEELEKIKRQIIRDIVFKITEKYRHKEWDELEMDSSA